MPISQINLEKQLACYLPNSTTPITLNNVFAICVHVVDTFVSSMRPPLASQKRLVMTEITIEKRNSFPIKYLSPPNIPNFKGLIFNLILHI